MGAHEDVDGAVEEPFEHLLTALALDDARQQGHAEVHAIEELHDGLQVLFCEDFRGCHDASLIAVVDGDEHRHQGHEGLPASHVALQQTVHLPARPNVDPDLPDHPFLCLRQREGQVLAIEGVEDLANLREDVASIFAAMVACVP